MQHTIISPLSRDHANNIKEEKRLHRNHLSERMQCDECAEVFDSVSKYFLHRKEH